jgi:hypothetical protein
MCCVEAQASTKIALAGFATAGLHVAMTTPHRFEEIEVERLVLREPKDGRVRAVLETVPPRGPDAGIGVPAVRLVMYSPTGDPALLVEVDETGTPSVYVGNPDRGTTAVVTRDAVDLWSRGNIVAALRSTDEGGRLELQGPQGTVVTP